MRAKSGGESTSPKTRRGEYTVSKCGISSDAPILLQNSDHREVKLVSHRHIIGFLCQSRNYTGDILNFGLAKEQYAAQHPDKADRVKFVIVGEDVAVGKTQGKIVGRRSASQCYSLLTYRTNLHAEASLARCLCTRSRALWPSVARVSMRCTRSLNGWLPTLEPSAWAWNIVTYVRHRITFKRHVLTCRFIATGPRNCFGGVSSRAL